MNCRKKTWIIPSFLLRFHCSLSVHGFSFDCLFFPFTSFGFWLPLKVKVPVSEANLFIPYQNWWGTVENGNVKFHSAKLQFRACYQTVVKTLERTSKVACFEFHAFNARQIRLSLQLEIPQFKNFDTSQVLVHGNMYWIFDTIVPNSNIFQ